DAFAPLGSVVFLSGDVHYGFSSATDYVGGDGRQARFVQLTSSAVKNWSEYTSVLAAVDNLTNAAQTTTQSAYDFVTSLPDQITWEGFGAEAQEAVPSSDKVLQAVSEQQAAAAAEASDSPADSWWTGLLDIVGAGTVLDDTG